MLYVKLFIYFLQLNIYSEVNSFFTFDKVYYRHNIYFESYICVNRSMYLCIYMYLMWYLCQRFPEFLRFIFLKYDLKCLLDPGY